jgi:hypothetical protein
MVVRRNVLHAFSVWVYTGRNSYGALVPDLWYWTMGMTVKTMSGPWLLWNNRNTVITYIMGIAIMSITNHISLTMLWLFLPDTIKEKPKVVTTRTT